MTLEDPAHFPPAVREMVPDDDAWNRLTAFAELLQADGVVRGVIGPREHDRLWSRHLVNSLCLAPFVPRDAQLGDVGSGAGFPGMVLAVARPDLQVSLIEPMERRVEWLEDVATTLAVSNVEVVRARAEELATTRSFPVVTARAVAALDKLCRWTLPLVAPKGRLLALKGARARSEVVEAKTVLQQWDATASVNEVVSPLDGASTFVVEVLPQRY